jgi:wyosine [tRNA(Phe)-imidazoG37] synthetase (radical SAM superfamily)
LKQRRRHVYGPVPSRRLGRSLGIDLIPYKTCSYDCVYCQLGRTTSKTIERKEYWPVDGILSELERCLDSRPPPDYVTLSGSGEPTLYSKLAALIDGIRSLTDRPVAVLTNGSLLWDRDVQESLLGADLVIPSLDAGDEAAFQRVNRPHPGISFERMVRGIQEFRRLFGKPMWLEVLLLRGLTATIPEVEKIAHLVERIGPHRVQLNTATRPPSEDFAIPASLEELKQAARVFGDRAEVIADYHDARRNKCGQARQEDILNLVARRPCTLQDVASGLDLNPNEVVKHLDRLVREHVLVCERDRQPRFYRLAERTGGGEHLRDNADSQ